MATCYHVRHVGRVVKRAFKYRFYPSDQQAEELNRTFGCVRKVYNLALEARTKAWYSEQRRVTYSADLGAAHRVEARPELAFLTRCRRCRCNRRCGTCRRRSRTSSGKRAKYPTFKSKRRSRASAEYTRSAFRFRDGALTLAKMAEPLDIRWSRPLPDGAEPTTVTVSRDAAGRWHVSLLCEVTVQDGPPTDAVVGIDAGITSLVTLSTGEKVTNPRHERRDRARLARAQRALARKQRGSANRAKARRKVARVHARITDRRRDHLHKLTTRLVRENQTVVIEDLQVAQHGQKPLPGPRHLRRGVAGAAGHAGVQVPVVRPRPGRGRPLVPLVEGVLGVRGRPRRLPLNVREWTCRCGARHDRDVNAARNIRPPGWRCSPVETV